MTTPTTTPTDHDGTVPCPEPTSGPGEVRPRPVVAIVLEWRGRVLLLKRSALVAHDRGRWHCVTGYVEAGRTTIEQAIDELYEETGLRVVDLASLAAGPVLSIRDATGQAWPVHTFKASTQRKRLTLNWEHDTYRWVRPSRLRSFDGRVQWVDPVISAVEANASATSPSTNRSTTAATGLWART